MRKVNDEDIVSAYCESDRTTAASVGKKYHISKSSARKILKKNGVNIRKHPSKYGIDLETIKEEFKEGYSNAELASKYGCSRNLIARRRYQYRMGMI